MESLIASLKELQSMVAKMYSQSHGYHWNIVGSGFPQYHKFLLKIYTDVFNSIDTYAESLRKLNQPAPFGLDQLQQNSALRINDAANLTAEQMFKELLITNSQIIDKLKDACDVAETNREQGILNFLAARLDQHQFWQWQISATLK